MGSVVGSSKVWLRYGADFRSGLCWFKLQQGALRESAKYMSKARTPDKDQRCAALGNRIELCERFVQVRCTGNPTQVERQAPHMAGPLSRRAGQSSSSDSSESAA